MVTAAEAIGVPNPTLYKWLKQGKVPGKKALSVVYLLEHTKQTSE